MKKFLLALLIAISFPWALHAQAYRPLLDSVNTWHYVGSPLFVRLQAPPSSASAPCAYPSFYYTYKIQYTVQDTIIDSLTYKIVREEVDMNPNPCDFGYVREDTAARKVYFRDNLGNPEILLYDFSLQVNDTFNIDFLFNNGNYPDGTYHLDSIVPFYTVSGTTRLFCFHPTQSPWMTMYWAEGIGCMLNAFYPYASNTSGSGVFTCPAHDYGCDEFISCYDHAQKVFYDSCAYQQALQNGCFAVTDTCDYYDICGSIDEHNIGAEVNIFPSPVHDCMHIRVNAEKTVTLSFTVFDLNGKDMNIGLPATQCAPGERDLSLAIEDLAPGEYLLQCSNGSERIAVPFIVQ